MKIAFTVANIYGASADLDDEEAQRHIDAGHAYAVEADSAESAEQSANVETAVVSLGKHESRD